MLLEDQDKVMDLYRQGAGRQEIADVVGCSIWTVDEVAKRYPGVTRVHKCEICGREFVRKLGRTPKTCGSKDCQREWNRRRAKEYREKRKLSKFLTTPKPVDEGPFGRVRPYTDASDRMIRWDLAKGWTVRQIAREYGRDPEDVAKHIRGMQRRCRG